MSLFAVKYVHPDRERWMKLLEAHLLWIDKHLESGHIVASGPLPDAPELSALILIHAENTDEVQRLVAEDPYVGEGLVTTLTIDRWDPGFGRLAEFAG